MGAGRLYHAGGKVFPLVEEADLTGVRLNGQQPTKNPVPSRPRIRSPDASVESRLSTSWTRFVDRDREP